MDSNMDNDSSNKLANMDKSSSEEVRMEEKMNQDFQRMNAVLTYHKNKREGLSQVYPDHYNKKEKDSLRRYANNYELESERLLTLMSEDKEPTSWDILIDPVLFSIRTSRNASTKMTPFRMMYGREARRPVEVAENDKDLSELEIKLPTEETIIKFMSSMETNREKDASRAIKNVEKAQEKHKKYYKARKTRSTNEVISFTLGQKVLLYDARRKTRQGGKLTKEWSGPHTITEIVGTKHVRLNGRKTIKNTKHLKPWNFSEKESTDVTECDITSESYELDAKATEQQEGKDNIAVGEKEQVGDAMKRENEEKSIKFESSLQDEEEIVDKKQTKDVNAIEESSNEILPTEQDMTKSNTRKRQPLMTSKKHGKRRRMKMLDIIEKMENIGKSCSGDEDIATDVEEEFANDTMEATNNGKKNAEKDNALETVECSYSIPREDDIRFEDTEVKYYEEDIVDERENSAFITKVKNITLEDDDNDPNLKPIVIDPKIVSSPHEVVDTIWNCGPVSYIESKIGMIHISDNKICELKGTTYVCDEIINSYLVALSQQYSTSHFKIQVIDSVILTEICNGMCYRAKLKKMRMSNFDLIMGGYHTGGNHWNLVVLKPKEEVVHFLNPFGELPTQIDKVMKNLRLFWRNRINELGEEQVNWQFVPLVHPKQQDSHNCGIFTLKFAEALLKTGRVDFLVNAEVLRKHRRDIAEFLIEKTDCKETGWCRLCGQAQCCCGRWLHIACINEKLDDDEPFQCKSCANALIHVEIAAENSDGHLLTSTPNKKKEIADKIQMVTKETATNDKCIQNKKKRTTPSAKHKLKMIKNTPKTRAKRCEQCRKEFKRNKVVDAKYIIGHHCDRPFYNKHTGTIHPGTRNYYFCVSEKCLRSTEPEINGSMIDISDVKSHLTKDDLEGFQKQGLTITL
eukprot:gene18532-20394_t